MDEEKYLQLIESQVREAEEHMKAMEKSLSEAKVKYNTLVIFKDSYVEWITSWGGSAK